MATFPQVQQVGSRFHYGGQKFKRRTAANKARDKDIAAQNQVDAAPGQSQVGTGLGELSLGEGVIDPAGIGQGRGVKSIDDLIRLRTDVATGIIGESNEEALRLARQAAEEQRAPLEDFQGLEAFDEQNALLGLSGEDAQEEAIGNIPVSQFDQELNRRARAGQARKSFASGDVSGASLLQGQTLAAGQQAQAVQGRIGALEPLVARGRATRSTLSQLLESSAAREAQLQSGKGTQLANIRIGGTAPIMQANMQRANLSGLQGIGNANQQAGMANQLASLAGRFAPQAASYFAPAPAVQGSPMNVPGNLAAPYSPPASMFDSPDFGYSGP